MCSFELNKDREDSGGKEEAASSMVKSKANLEAEKWRAKCLIQKGITKSVESPEGNHRPQKLGGEERKDCEGKGVDPVAIWGGRQRRGWADGERMRVGVRAGERGVGGRHRGMACDKGRMADEWDLEARGWRHMSILVDSEAKASPYLTVVPVISFAEPHN
jgi:hypothetical protein